MLLFVVQTEFEQRCGLMPHRLARALDEAADCSADMVAISADDVAGRARQQAPLGPRVTRADRLVIGVKEVGEGRIKNPIVGVEPVQDERLKEPGRMRQMPFCRACIRHRLNCLVFGRQVDRQRFAVAPHGCEPIEHDLAIRAAGLCLRGTFRHGTPQSISLSRLTLRKLVRCARRDSGRANGARSSLCRAGARWRARPAPPSTTVMLGYAPSRPTTQKAA